MAASPARCFLVLAAALALLSQSAAGHVPHDVAVALAPSPDFAADRTLFASFWLIDQRVLARSFDGGRDWEHVGFAPALHGVQEFAFSPSYAADGIVFAATNGGLYRTGDRGGTWQRLDAGLPLVTITDVAVSPSFATNRVVLATTGGGLFRSTNGGNSWTAVVSGLGESDLASVAFVPDDPSGRTAFVGGKILHRSSDAGATWTVLRTFADRLVEIAPSPQALVDGRIVLAFLVTGVLASSNLGATWTSYGAGLTDDLMLDVDWTDTGVLFATTRVAGVFRSASFLQPWTLQIDGITPPDATTSNHYREVRASPAFAADQTVFLASTEGVWISTDGGDSWSESETYHQRVHMRVAVSPDHPRDREVHVANFGGGVMGWRDPPPEAVEGGTVRAHAANPSAKQSGGSAPIPGVPGSLAPPPGAAPYGTWTTLSSGLGSLYSDGVVHSPAYAEDDTLYFHFFGLYRSHDRGRTWTNLPLPPGVDIVRDVALSPDFARDRTLFAGTNGIGLFRSVDGGDTWTSAAGGLPPSLATKRLVLSPGFPSDGTLFVASWDHGVWKSTNAGDAWTPCVAGLATAQMQSLAVSPGFAVDGIVLAGTKGDGLYRSADGGATWTRAAAGFPADDLLVVSGLAFSPSFVVDGTAFALTTLGGVHRTTDAGLSWAPWGAGLPRTAGRDLAVSPGFVHDRTLFAASHEGLFRSRDAGATWDALPVLVRVDNNAPMIVSGGTWGSTAASGVQSNTVAVGAVAGSTRTLQFKGRALEWHVLAAPDAGIAEVFLDDVLVESVDLYAPVDTPRIAFTAAWDAPAWRTITVRVTGMAHPDASDARVFDDGFAYVR